MCLSVLGAGAQSSPSTPAPRPKVISFAWVDSSGVHLGHPQWVTDWIAKKGSKFDRIRFSETPVQGADNYLVVLSASVEVLSGFQPVPRIITTTSTADISGSGTATDNEGDSWRYRFSGSATTTTTTMTHEDVPYTVETRTTYASAYGGPSGLLVSRHQASTSQQQGGDPTSALASDLGDLVHRVHLKTRMLNSVIRDIAELP